MLFQPSQTFAGGEGASGGDPVGGASIGASTSGTEDVSRRAAKERRRQAAEAWADVVFDVLDEIFRFPVVEHCDPTHLEDVLAQHEVQAFPAISADHDQEKGGSEPGRDDCQAAAIPADLRQQYCPDQQEVFSEGRRIYDAGFQALKARMDEPRRHRLVACWAELEAVTGEWASAAAGLLRALRLAGEINPTRRGGLASGATKGEIAEGAPGVCGAEEGGQTGQGSGQDRWDFREGSGCGVRTPTRVTHIVVTRGQLLASMAKMMLFGFGNLVRFVPEGLRVSSSRTI